MFLSSGRKSGRQAGFTLIELLIVITIIGILAVVAVTSYAGVQRQAAVDFAGDTLVATIREAEDWARSGRRSPGLEGESSKSLCYAVKIVTGIGEQARLYYASSDYVAVEGETVDSCEVLGDLGWRKSDVFNDRIVLIGDGDTFVYYFKPPFGKIYTEAGGALTSATSRVVTFTVGDPENPSWNNTISFDLSTSEVKKVKVSS